MGGAIKNMKEPRVIPFRLSSKLSEFDRAFNEDLATKLQEQTRTIISGENALGYSHGKKWRTRTANSDGEANDGEMKTHSSEVAIPFQEIVDNDLHSVSRYQNIMISGMMQEFMSSFYQVISDASAKTGNVVDGKGEGFKAELFVEVLEKIEFGVDQEGKVSMPQIHAGPELADKIFRELSAQGPEFEEKVQKIIKRKSEEALEREEDRKSKFPKLGRE